MFVPTLRLNSLAYKIHRNSINLNQVNVNKFTFDTRRSNKYCTRVINIPTNEIRSTGGEILLSPLVDFKNNLTFNSVNCANVFNKHKGIQAYSQEITTFFDVEDTTNNPNTVTQSSDQVKKQPPAETLTRVDDLMDDKSKFDQIMTNGHILKEIGTKLVNFSFAISLAALVVACVIVAFIWGSWLCIEIIQLVLLHPKLSLSMALGCVFTFLLLLF
jgi:hypothetical protein